MTDNIIEKVRALFGLREDALGEIEKLKILAGLACLEIEGEVGPHNMERWASINLPEVPWPLIQESIRIARAHETVRGKQITEVSQ